MATAPKKARTGRPAARDAHNLLASAPLEFRVHQDNRGDYHWQIIGEGGINLAQSGSFASRDDAERAARCVRDGAGSARFEPPVADERQLAVA